MLKLRYNSMIPKIIHYCWMSGDPYPSNIQKCIDSWHKYLPDYEIWLWDSKRFDIESSMWVKEAYEMKKYAFCADYIRLYALYNYGGIYLDSDVEVLKSYNELLDLPYFMGLESKGIIEAATIGAEKKCPIIKELLEYYQGRHFKDKHGNPDIIIMPSVIQNVIKDRYTLNVIKSKDDFINKKNVLNVFPFDRFSPIDSTGKRYVLKTSNHTYSIHHFASAWVDPKVMLLVKIFGYNSKTRLLIQRIAKWIRDKIIRRIKF